MDFLQSEQWRKFQEAAGRRTFLISSNNFHASIIEHNLPIVGKYFYVPRGPICHLERSGAESKDLIGLDSSTSSRGETALGMTKLLDLAKKEKAGWIRIDVSSEGVLKTLGVQEGHPVSIKKAPHDMQPQEVFLIDISKTEEELLGEMKAKTRYNVKLAEKKGVEVFCVSEGCHPELDSGSNKNSELSQSIRFRVKPGMTNKYLEEFLRLVKITAERDKITPHPEEYYQKMLEVISEENLQLYVAEFEGKIIAANLVVFYGQTATYLHGASDNENRNVMAPFLLQWRQIQDAKKGGCTRYDFGGVKSNGDSSWAGITKFKTSFSPNTKATEFLGSYDIILDSKKYYLYRAIQYLKGLL